MSDYDIELDFQKIVKLVQDLPKEGPYKPSNDEKLKFYALYKQATEGKCNTQRPGFFDLVGKAKWDAWAALGDMSEEEAKEEYISEFHKMEVKMKNLGLVKS